MQGLFRGWQDRPRHLLPSLPASISISQPTRATSSHAAAPPLAAPAQPLLAEPSPSARQSLFQIPATTGPVAVATVLLLHNVWLQLKIYAKDLTQAFSWWADPVVRVAAISSCNFAITVKGERGKSCAQENK